MPDVIRTRKAWKGQLDLFCLLVYIKANNYNRKYCLRNTIRNLIYWEYDSVDSEMTHLCAL